MKNEKTTIIYYKILRRSEEESLGISWVYQKPKKAPFLWKEQGIR